MRVDADNLSGDDDGIDHRDHSLRWGVAAILFLLAVMGGLCAICGGGVFVREAALDTIPGPCNLRMALVAFGGVAVASIGLAAIACVGLLPAYRGPYHQTPWWLWALTFMILPIGVAMARHGFRSGWECQLADLSGFG